MANVLAETEIPLIIMSSKDPNPRKAAHLATYDDVIQRSQLEHPKLLEDFYHAIADKL